MHSGCFFPDIVSSKSYLKKKKIAASIPRFPTLKTTLCQALQTYQGNQGLVIIDLEIQITKSHFSGLGHTKSSYIRLLVLEDI